MDQTTLVISNKWTDSVTVYLTLGVGAGFLSDIKKIPFVKHHTNEHQGYFTLEAGDEVSFTSPKNLVFSGNVSFNSPPLNCPSPEFPMCINLGEFTLNNHHANPANWETIDISNVAGANSYMEFSLSGGGKWNAGSKHPDVTKFRNGSLGNNVGRVGVYPYACDDCTASVSPPVCSTKPKGAPVTPVPQKDAICNVQRDSSKAGGTVTLSYLGPIAG